jgi:uroporphyrin-3 C-methyltransferase
LLIDKKTIKMSQTRQPVHVFPKITLKLGVWGRVGLILAIITAIASYVLYHNGVRYKNREKLHYAELSQQVQALTVAQRQTSDQNAALHQQIKELQGQINQLTAGLQPEQQRQWLIRQVGRYLQLADQQLLLQADIPSAQLLLDVADKLLAEHPDNNLLELRQAIAADKLALATAQQLDKVGLSLRLDALKQQASQFAPPSRQQVSQAGHPESLRAEDDSPWSRGWLAFRQLITIRHYDQPVRPLLADDQRWLLQQEVYLALSQAQLALWDNQQSRYQQSLKEIEQLLADYQQLSPQYAAIITEARALAAVSLQVTTPTLTHSQQVLVSLAEPVPAPSTVAAP